MNIITLIIIGVFFLLGVIITIGSIILYRISNKTKIRVNILLKTRNWYRFKVKTKKLVSNKTIEVKDHKTGYVFDDRGIIKGKFIDNIYYYEGNPEPIMFDFQSNIPKTQAKDLQTILDSDLIEKLFNEKRLERMEFLMIIILIVVSITLLAVAGQYFAPTNIQSDSNAEWIYNITKTAITGGMI